MSWWQKIIKTGKSLRPDTAHQASGAVMDFSPEDSETPPMPPARFELVEGSLFAGINLHDVNLGTGNFSCWSYLSDGLGQHGQKEMSFLVKMNEGQLDDQYPLEPLGFLYTVKDFAAKGQLVDEWDITEFGNTGFIKPQFKAIAYLPPEPISAFEEKTEIVTGIPITEDELSVARNFGLTRLIGLLGQKFSHYPCPPWADLERTSVVSSDMLQSMQQSMVAKLPHMRVPGVSVSLVGNDIVLRAKPMARTYIEEQMRQLPDSFPLVLRAELDRYANALLVWQESYDGGPSAITPPGSDGSRVSGSFLIFLPEQEETEGQVLEDGFVLRMRNEVWAVLKKHLLHGSNIKILADTAGMGFILEWIPEDAQLRLDRNGNVYPSTSTLSPAMTPDNFVTIQPPSKRSEAAALKVKNVVLLSPEAQITASISPQLLASFAAMIETIVIQFFTRQPAVGLSELIVQCQVLPAKKAEWILTSTPGLDNAKATELETQLDSLSVPTLTGDPISFQVVFSMQ